MAVTFREQCQAEDRKAAYRAGLLRAAELAEEAAAEWLALGRSDSPHVNPATCRARADAYEDFAARLRKEAGEG